MKKEIKQVDKFGDVSFQVGRDGISLIQIADGATNWVIIEKSKAREVALAICPELGEPTIKTDNTKVIAHLESELEKAKELLKNAEVLFLLERTAPDFSATEYYSRATEIMKGINSFLECK